SKENQIVLQSVRPHAVKPPRRVVFVLDGAKSMTSVFPSLAEVLQKLPEGIELTLLLAQDGVKEISGPVHRGDAAFYREVSARLRSTKGVGGQDNVAALIRAWDLAEESASSVVVWIHGPQPVLPGNSEELKQGLEWRSGSASVLLDLQTEPGP